MHTIFSDEAKRVITEELNTTIRIYMNYLEENDDDEYARYRMFTIMWLRNTFETGIIDRLEISDAELDDIFTC